MKGKVNKRDDECVHLLLKIACHKAYMNALSNLRKERYHTELMYSANQWWEKTLANQSLQQCGGKT